MTGTSESAHGRNRICNRDGTMAVHCWPNNYSYPQQWKATLHPERPTAIALVCCRLLFLNDKARLKIPRRKPCGFDFRSGHQSLKRVIVLNLLCDRGHCFEGWFASGDAFRDQRQRQLVHCTQCQTSGISQLPSAPHVKRGAADVTMPERSAVPVLAPDMAQLHQALVSMARKAENVGERFPEEARRIHPIFLTCPIPNNREA